EVKARDPHVTGRCDRAALPSIREQRPGLGAGNQGGVGLGEQQPPPERRADRRDQESVVTPRQAAGDGTAGVAAEAIGEPPFAAFRLDEVAADRPWEADRRGRGRGRAAGAPRHVGLGLLPQHARTRLQTRFRHYGNYARVTAIALSRKKRRVTAASWPRSQYRENRRPARNFSGTARNSGSSRRC